MNKAEEFLKLPYFIVAPSLEKIDLDDTFNRFEVIQLLEAYHQSRVNAISDDEIKDIIFKNQCYGNSTKMVKEIKSLLKQ